MRRLLYGLVALAVIAACLGACLAEGVNDLVHNYILIIDNSRSTTGRHSLGGATDPNGLRFDAAKLVYENVLSSAETGSRGKIGVIVFCGPENCVTYGPMDIDADPDALQEAIGSRLNAAANKDRRDNYTDIRTAMETAQAMMDGFTEGQTSVILLTDGVNDLLNLSDPLSRPENIEANEKTVEIIKDMSDSGAAFSVIALTASENARDTDTFMDFIDEMAEAGGGEKQADGSYGNVLMATQSDLNSKLLKSMIRAESASGVNIQNIVSDTPVGEPIMIPYDGISDATINITFMPEDKRKLEGVTLVSPDGVEYKLYGDGATEEGDIAVTEDRSYLILDIPTPQPGEWQLKIDGKKDAAVPIDAVVRIHQKLKLSAAAPKNMTVNAASRIKAWIKQYDGERYVDLVDSDIYDMSTATLKLTSPGGETREIDMRQDGSRYVAEIVPEEAGIWTIAVSARNDYWSYETDGYSIEALPEPTAEPVAAEAGGGTSQREEKAKKTAAAKEEQGKKTTAAKEEKAKQAAEVSWNVEAGEKDGDVKVSWSGGPENATAELWAEGGTAPLMTGIQSGDSVDLSELGIDVSYTMLLSSDTAMTEEEMGEVPMQALELSFDKVDIGQAADTVMQVANAVMQMKPKVMTADEVRAMSGQGALTAGDGMQGDSVFVGATQVPGSENSAEAETASGSGKTTSNSGSGGRKNTKTTSSGGSGAADTEVEEAAPTEAPASEPEPTEQPETQANESQTAAPSESIIDKIKNGETSPLDLLKQYWKYAAIGAGVLVLLIVIIVVSRGRGGEKVTGNLRIECEKIMLSQLIRFEGRGQIKVGSPLTSHPDIAKLRGSKVYDVLSGIRVSMTQADQFGKARGSEAEHKPYDKLIRLTFVDPDTKEERFCDVGKYDASPNTLEVKDAGRKYELTCSGSLTFDELLYANRK